MAVQKFSSIAPSIIHNTKFSDHFRKMDHLDIFLKYDLLLTGNSNSLLPCVSVIYYYYSC